jgi:hypothetical protein
MANAVEEALNRAKRAEIDKTIGNAQREIDSAKMQMGNDPNSNMAATIAQNEQIIAEARHSIPFESMQSVDSISPPMNTPAAHGLSNPEPVNLNPTFQMHIEKIQQGPGNNYLNENAVDRAMDQQSQAAQQIEPPQQEMER